MKSATIIACFIFSLVQGAPHKSLQVIGGKDVQSHIFPYQVSIQSTLLNENKHICGGAIISPSWIVTAAHCVGLSLLVARVVAGTFDLSNVENNTEVQIRTIDLYNVVKHPEFKDNINDIALLKMSQPFEFNEFVQPLSISRVPCVAEDDPAVFSGWGARDIDNNFSNIMQTANLTIISYDDCYKKIKSVYDDNIPVFKDTHICVTGQAAPCVLDGGGPLVQDNKLVGILSWLSAACSNTDVPAIFTNAGYFKKFIKEYVDDLVYQV